MKKNFLIRYKRIISGNPQSRGEYIGFMATMFGVVEFIGFSILFYKIHELVIWTAFLLALVCALGGYIAGVLSWWVGKKMGFFSE